MKPRRFAFSLACAVVHLSATAAHGVDHAFAQDATSQNTPATTGATTTTPTTPATASPAPQAAETGASTPPSDAALAARNNASQEQARAEAELALRRAVIPEPISPERFAALLAATDSSLAANKDIAEQYALYRATLTRLAEDPGRRILQLLPASYNFDAARNTFETRPTPTLMELLSLRDRAAREAAEAEKSLFRAIMLATPIEKRAKLAFERIAEINARLTRAGQLPSTALTMREMLDRARLSDASRAATNAIVLAYADALTALTIERSRILLESDAARAAIESEAGMLWRYGSNERVASTEERLDVVDDLEFASEIAIRDAHLALLRRLRATLPRPEGRRLIEQWQRATHPELFDDERILAQLVETVVARAEIAAETQTAVLDALDATYARLEPLSDAASATADRILPRLVERSRDSVQDEIAARIELLDIQRKRRVLVKDALARIRAIAGGSPPETLARFEDLAQTIAALERADRAERTGLEALTSEVAAKPADESIAPSTGAPSSPNTVKPNGGATTTPSSSSSKGSSGSNSNGTSNRGRSGRGSRNPIND